MQDIQLTEQALISKYIDVNNRILQYKKSEYENLIKQQKQIYRKEFETVILIGLAVAGCSIASFHWLIH